MKNLLNFKFIIVVIILFLTTSFNNVYAYEVNGKDYKFTHASGKTDSDVKKACVYTTDGYYSQEKFSIVFIYNDNSAHHNALNESGTAIDNDYAISDSRGIHNWTQVEGGAIGLNTSTAQSEFINSQQCPETIYHKNSSGFLHLKYYELLGYDKNLPEGKTIDDVKEALNYRSTDSVWYDKLVTEKEYAPEDLIKCEYDNFDIMYTKEDGVVRAAEYNGYYSEYALPDMYYITNSYRNSYNLLDKGKCPVVYACKKVEWAGYASYYLYTDEFDANEAYEGCSANRKICVGGEYCDPDYLGICPTFDNKYRDLKNSYNDYNKNNNIGSLRDAKKIQNQLKNLCRSITKYTNYNSPCFEQCNKLGELIEAAKGEKNSYKGECGFSERLIQWIANIIRWVKYIIPVAVIVLGILDFIKAISADKDDEMKKAEQRFIRRLIAAALIFIAPFIIEFILIKLGFAANGCGIINL